MQKTQIKMENLRASENLSTPPKPLFSRTMRSRAKLLIPREPLMIPRRMSYERTLWPPYTKNDQSSKVGSLDTEDT